VGGGVFLAPILIALHLGFTQADGGSFCALHLGKLGRRSGGGLYAGQSPSPDTWLYALAALAGAMIGTTVGLRWLSQTMTRYALATILGTAGLQLLIFPHLWG
jgi:uncharacterized protein